MLQGYKRKGKRLIAPMNQIGSIRDSSWYDSFPELLWIAMVQYRYGEQRSIDLIHRFCEEIVKTQDLKWPPFLVSDFCDILQEDRFSKRDDYSWFFLAQAPMANNYPDYPVSIKVLGNYDIGPDQNSISHVRTVVQSLVDKRSRFSSVVLATWMSLLIRFEKVFFAHGVEIPDLNAIADYPDTEQSQRTAGYLRAGFNAHTGPEDICLIWPRKFYKWSYRLTDCQFNEER